ncbi:Xylose isomerase-like TIM barrel [Rubripirellula amarantea]|uniref:Xylose isomerase-like TIM barrel n=1 Tax=Rubripirellula amarantea TaxID=2527999 RepID=A0A5C5WKB8_9BACT|nr:sugar phosphate isomerase/epimerase family protein [Rubripirellula amarantea]TWT51226.1 Xylose isomerase-like TIM barrel [Rubripirellula amarantea]
MKRRQFLNQSLCLSSMAFVAGSGGQSLLAREPIVRSGPPRFQLSLAAYSLRDYFEFNKGKRKPPRGDGPAIDMLGFLDYCVEHGFDAAELTSYFFPSDADDDYFRELKRQAFIRGMAISGTAIGNNFTVGKGENLDREIADAIAWIDKAALLGAPHIRFFAGTGWEVANHPKRIDEAIDALNVCAAHAASRGIFLGIENHGNLTVTQMLEIMKRVDSPWVGMNLDTGNFFSDTPYRDLVKCVPYAVNVQVKLTMQTPDKKRYPADLDRIGRILRYGGYQGFVVLEYEEDQPYQEIPGATEKLRQALSRQ